MKTDSAFLADLDASRSRVDRFASLHRRRGVEIWQHPEVTRDDSSERGQFGDSGDMLMLVRVEHKVRGFDFTDATDFPYSGVIVDEAYKIDRMGTRPFVYVIENKSGTRAIVVSSRSRGRWSLIRRNDPQQRRECEFYEAPLSAVRFCDVGDVF